MLLLTLFVIGLAVWGLFTINRKKGGQVIGLICIVLSFIAWVVFCAINIKTEDDTIKAFSAKTRSDLALPEKMVKLPVGSGRGPGWWFGGEASDFHYKTKIYPNRKKYLSTEEDSINSEMHAYYSKEISDHANRMVAASKTLDFYRAHPRLVFLVSGWPDPTRKFEAISRWLDSPLNWSIYPAQILGPLEIP